MKSSKPIDQSNFSTNANCLKAVKRPGGNGKKLNTERINKNKHSVF